MNRYKKLAVNSLIFAVGNLGSKFISLILVPLYTYYLSTQEYGMVDIVTTTIALLLPCITMSIYEAVLRFAMDNKYKKMDILTNALMITIFGFIIALLVFPILYSFFSFKGLVICFYIYLFTQSLNASLLQFIRAIGKVKLYSLIGIVGSLVVLFSTFIFIVYFHIGIIGYLLSLIFADLVCFIFIIVFGKVHEYLSIKNVNIALLKKMLVYCTPLIPNAMMWWIMNVSDRYLITLFLGYGINGLYAVANKLPNILNMISSIFFQAWQMSAIEEVNSRSKSQFYTNVFSILAAAMFICTSIFMAFLKPIIHFVIAPTFYDAWIYVPFLLLAIVFASFSTFIGTNYIAAKNTAGVFRTTIAGAIINVVGNLALIPFIGAIGASISTMLSYFLIWIIRMVETKKFVAITINISKFIINLCIIMIQILIIYLSPPLEFLYQIFLLFFIILTNLHEIWALYRKFVGILITNNFKNKNGGIQ